ncbi:uncharacterized protein A4U43_C08F23450 [Asparagus officinalis]|nr:uncharacterized protein A4U43_C08F23450 [Asparagus officinalis]
MQEFFVLEDEVANPMLKSTSRVLTLGVPTPEVLNLGAHRDTHEVAKALDTQIGNEQDQPKKGRDEMEIELDIWAEKINATFDLFQHHASLIAQA